jgi:hypothetical protein
MTSTQGNAVWKLAPFLEGNDRKGTTTAGFPVDRDVLRVDLDAL